MGAVSLFTDVQVHCRFMPRVDIVEDNSRYINVAMLQLQYEIYSAYLVKVLGSIDPYK